MRWPSHIYSTQVKSVGKLALALIGVMFGSLVMVAQASSDPPSVPVDTSAVKYRFALGQADSDVQDIQRQFDQRFTRFNVTGSEVPVPCRYAEPVADYRCIIAAG